MAAILTNTMMLLARADSRMPRTRMTVRIITTRKAGMLKPKCHPDLYRSLPASARQHGRGAQGHRGGRCLRLAGRWLTESRSGTTRHLRGARQRIYGAPIFRSRRARHVSRLHREDPASHAAGCERGGVAAGPRILRRRPPDGAGPDELLGL